MRILRANSHVPELQLSVGPGKFESTRRGGRFTILFDELRKTFPRFSGDGYECQDCALARLHRKTAAETEDWIKDGTFGTRKWPLQGHRLLGTIATTHEPCAIGFKFKAFEIRVFC